VQDATEIQKKIEGIQWQDNITVEFKEESDPVLVAVSFDILLFGHKIKMEDAQRSILLTVEESKRWNEDSNRTVNFIAGQTFDHELFTKIAGEIKSISIEHQPLGRPCEDSRWFGSIG